MKTFAPARRVMVSRKTMGTAVLLLFARHARSRAIVSLASRCAACRAPAASRQAQPSGSHLSLQHTSGILTPMLHHALEAASPCPLLFSFE